jgi:hypothetical protein
MREEVIRHIIGFLVFTFMFPWPPIRRIAMSRVVTTTHHMVPRSRAKAVGVHSNDPRNLCTLERGRHEAYHALFSNRTPEECLLYFANNFVPSLDYYGAHIKNGAVLRFLEEVKKVG